jgi:hypothetical protein
MTEIIQQGEVREIKVNDESKSAEIIFYAQFGNGTLGFNTLRPTKDNDEAYNAMVSLAVLGLHYGTLGGNHVHVRYDNSGSEAMELDEISIHRQP